MSRIYDYSCPLLTIDLSKFMIPLASWLMAQHHYAIHGVSWSSSASARSSSSQSWAWALGVGLQGFGILDDIYTFTQGNTVGAIIGLIIAAIILYYLFTPNVRKAFGC
jgi:hypothetical protein